MSDAFLLNKSNMFSVFLFGFFIWLFGFFAYYVFWLMMIKKCIQKVDLLL